jgi:hypothetical protein
VPRLLLATLALLALDQVPFRASLTAAVIISTGRDGGKHAARAVSASASGDALGCREIALRWAVEARAERYDVYVSPRADGPWTVLPAANVCGAVRRTAATALVDVEPTGGAASVVHRLYYKVFALRRTPAGATPIAVTDVVGVELP